LRLIGHLTHCRTVQDWLQESVPDLTGLRGKANGLESREEVTLSISHFASSQTKVGAR
jgi:hypothetical protein